VLFRREFVFSFVHGRVRLVLFHSVCCFLYLVHQNQSDEIEIQRSLAAVTLSRISANQEQCRLIECGDGLALVENAALIAKLVQGIPCDAALI